MLTGSWPICRDNPWPPVTGSENIFGGKPIESLSPANYGSPTDPRITYRRELPWEDSALASDLTELGQEARESLGEVPRANLSRRPQRASGAHCYHHRSDLHLVGRWIGPGRGWGDAEPHYRPGFFCSILDRRRNGACKNFGRPMPSHKFKIGDVVNLKPAISRNVAGGTNAAPREPG